MGPGSAEHDASRRREKSCTASGTRDLATPTGAGHGGTTVVGPLRGKWRVTTGGRVIEAERKRSCDRVRLPRHFVRVPRSFLRTNFAMRSLRVLAAHFGTRIV